MKKITLLLVILQFSALALLAQSNNEKKKSCYSEHKRKIPIDELQSRWSHYKFYSESDVKRDLENNFRGYKIDYKSWEYSDKGPGQGNRYDDIEHMSTMIQKKNQREWEQGPSLFKALACQETGSGPQLIWVYGWW